MKNTGFAVVLAALLLTGCRSDADRMAEFCLSFVGVVENSSSCAEMAANIDRMLASPQTELRDESVCADTTACLPCKKAARIMLGQCGYAPEMEPVLRKMHFSKVLRE